MNKIIFLIMLFVLISCQDSVERFDCQKVDYIDVYFAPFDIQSPVPITKEDIKLDLHLNPIEDKDKLQKICTGISRLKEIKDTGFMDTKVHLRADFIYKGNEILTVLSDGNTFKIGRRFYELDTELLNLLIE